MFNLIPRGFLLISFICLFFSSGGQDGGTVTARFTAWYHGKDGAVSISFDDAGYTQYTYAYPILEKYSVKATFSIVGEWVQEEPSLSAEPGHFEYLKMGWRQLLDLNAHGHELAAHGFNHERYNKFGPVDSLTQEMLRIKSLIEDRIHHQVFTMHYPYSYASGNIPEAADRAGFLFCRSGLDTINPAYHAEMHLLASQAILSSSKPDATLFSHWLDMAEGNWLILMYHNLFREDSKEMYLLKLHNVEYSYTLPPGLFEEQLKTVIERDYWVAPIASVGKYVMERDNTVITVLREKKKIFLVTSTCLDTRIYDQPLSLEVTIPWKRVRIEGSCRDGLVEVKNGKLLLDVRPEGIVKIIKVR